MRSRVRKRLWPTIVSAGLFALCVGLGIWQLDRAQFKLDLIEAIESRAAMPPVALTAERSRAFGADLGDAEHRVVSVRGRYLPEHTLFLDNKILDAQPGVHVLMPMRLDMAEFTQPTYLLINRGWTALGTDRTALPEVDTPSGVSMVTVRIKQPDADVFSLGTLPTGADWPQLWTHLDMQEFQNRLGVNMLPWLGLLISGDGGTGLEQRWPQGGDGWVNRHRGYAAQWFLMAVVLLVMYVVLMRRIDD